MSTVSVTISICVVESSVSKCIDFRCEILYKYSRGKNFYYSTFCRIQDGVEITAIISYEKW